MANIFCSPTARKIGTVLAVSAMLFAVTAGTFPDAAEEETSSSGIDLAVTQEAAVDIIFGYEELLGFVVHPNADQSGLEVTLPNTAPTATIQVVENELNLLEVPVEITIGPPVKLMSRLYGGEAIASGTFGCTAAFQVFRGDQSYRVTAGHCARGGAAVWYDANLDVEETRERIGVEDLISYPEFDESSTSDFMLIKEDADADTRSDIVIGYKYTEDGDMFWNNGTKAIDSVRTAEVGDEVCTMGMVSGERCGEVTGINISLGLNDGDSKRQFDGLIKTNLCSESGDSGGPLYTRTNTSEPKAAVGILSASMSETCWSDNADDEVSYFQPMREITNLGYAINP